ncbi:exo-1,3-beta-D-glucanase [Colletotrichum higginsianum IMI 349063]|uniref:Exo-1,3-beta-D-glucanase n=2 Tax=Colletotrichum higginsianum TaxID=80884 RepID=A0A1B7YT50_COLHI|nr:exo-1,3-beta-D-glucanase [Colletotrichum higginsianum IMI 349063]OBR15220.1 exo-1,3-beta-D-glucanase [Colletotrichum higginsianum IMI 349063]TID04006.1 hypothetical protein CH35J_002964 [Colletotrichum higginsianum]
MLILSIARLVGIVAFTASLVAGEAAVIASAPPRRIQEAPSSAVRVSEIPWTTFYTPSPSTRPSHPESPPVEPSTRSVETLVLRLGKRDKVSLEEQDRICHNETDHSPHSPVDSQKQEKSVAAFCGLLRGRGGYMEVGMESQRMEFQDLNSVHHHLKVEWAAACETDVEKQSIRRPLGEISAAPNCDSLMRDNYINCKNGGVGGKVQVGCLIYTYNGGIMPGREYDW